MVSFVMFERPPDLPTAIATINFQDAVKARTASYHILLSVNCTIGNRVLGGLKNLPELRRSQIMLSMTGLNKKNLLRSVCEGENPNRYYHTAM